MLAEPTWKIWRRNNREKNLATRRVYYARNAEKEKARVRKWKADNRDKFLNALRRWKQSNVEHIREYNQKWNEEHPDSMMERCHKRRARKKNNSIEHFTQSQFREIVEQYDGKCLRCGSAEDIVPDHVISLANGGSDGIENIQPLCRGCNSWKHSKTIDFRKRRLEVMSSGKEI